MTGSKSPSTSGVEEVVGPAFIEVGPLSTLVVPDPDAGTKTITFRVEGRVLVVPAGETWTIVRGD